MMYWLLPDKLRSFRQLIVMIGCYQTNLVLY